MSLSSKLRVAYPLNGNANSYDGSYNLTAVNSPTFTSGLGRQVANFVGSSDQQFTYANDAIHKVPNGSSWTAAGFFRVTSTPSGSNKQLMCRWDLTTNQREWQLNLDIQNNSGQLRFDVSTDGTFATNVFALWSTAPTVNQWYCFFAEVDRTANKIRLGIDLNTPVETSFSGNVFSGSGLFRIGGGPSSPTAFTGNISGVCIFNQILATQEKTEFYNKGLALLPPFNTFVPNAVVI